MDDARIALQHDGPLDARSAAHLAEQGLTLARLRNEVRDEFEAWQQAVQRGFLGDEPSLPERDAGFAHLAYRRLVSVLDPEGAVPEVPVATLGSWLGELTVPAGRLESCGISSVTVSPTHRRRGIARALLEGELRTAAELDIPVASLTVSESPLYGRYGFGLAASVASLRVDVRRAGWAGPVPAGRIDFVSRAQWRERVPGLFDRVRTQRPGEFTMPGGHWDRFAGTRPDAEKPGRIRAVQYTAPDGTVRGLALYTVTENEDDFARSRVDVASLLADGDDAYAALWRFLIELDLIGTLHAGELSVDEPLLWMLADRRGARVTLHDHHYLRILDVAQALQARRYRVAGRVLLDVADPLGITGGRFVLTVDDDGTAEVAPATGRATATVSAELGVAELSSLLLGQVSARTLASAGRLRSSDAGAVADLFSWDPPARLSYWY